MLHTIPRMPQMEVESAPERMETQLKIRMITPIKLSAIPVIPLQVIRSLMTMAEMMSVMMGLSVLMMDASIAVHLVMAKRNDSCVMNRPRKEAMATFQMSFFSMWSCDAVKSDQIQNSAVAPNERKQNSAIGVMLPSMAMFLQLMILKPKIAYAVKHARFPIRALFFLLDAEAM